jgi:hypothetical protein
MLPFYVNGVAIPGPRFVSASWLRGVRLVSVVKRHSDVLVDGHQGLDAKEKKKIRKSRGTKKKMTHRMGRAPVPSVVRYH